MKSASEKQVVQVRRYSDHPVIQAKVARAKEVLDKADLSFLEKPVLKK